MRFAYADPPYQGEAFRYEGGAEVNHAELIDRLLVEYPDGWALSMKTASLRELLPLVPAKHRVLAWVKPWASWKRGMWPAYAWEPIVMVGGRNIYGERQTPRDYVSERAMRETGMPGAKPLAFCLWLFDCLGARPGDTLDDLYPGSGAVGWAYQYFETNLRLPFEDAYMDEQLEASP